MSASQSEEKLYETITALMSTLNAHLPAFGHYIDKYKDGKGDSDLAYIVEQNRYFMAVIMGDLQKIDICIKAVRLQRAKARHKLKKQKTKEAKERLAIKKRRKTFKLVGNGGPS